MDWDLMGWFLALSNLVIGLYYWNLISWTVGSALLVALINDWWNRKGKRAMRALGDKSRAMLARLVFN
jgi:SNF family Na+-dependent transporter